MIQGDQNNQNSFYALFGLERIMQYDKIIMQNVVKFSEDDQVDSYRYFFPIINQGTQRSDPLFQINNPISWIETLLWSCKNQKIIINNDNKEFLMIKKDFVFTIPYLFCCDHLRPHFSIFYLEEGQKFMMGKILNPVDCCGNHLEILDDHLETVFTIQPNCCQCQLLCCFSICCVKGCFQEGCTLSVFDIYDSHGEQVGFIQKKKNDEFYSKTTDYMQLNYPKDSNEHQRALLLGAMMFLEFKYFAAPLKQQN